MRKLALYGGLLAIIVGGVPYFTGQLVEIRFKDVATTFTEIETLPVKVIVTEYKRGWRRSYAKTRVTLFDKHSSKVQPLHFTLEHDIRHGPFVQVQDDDYRHWEFARALITGQLYLSDRAKQILLSQVGGTDLLNLRSEIKINGAVSIQIAGKTLKLKEHEGTQRVAWQGVQGRWELSKDGKNLNGEVVLPGFDFDWGDVRYLANNLQYKTSLLQNSQGFWPGKFMMSGQQIKVENVATKASIEVKGLVSGGMMEANANVGDFSGSLQIEKLKIRDQAYGPIHFKQTIKNLNLPALTSLWALSQKAATQLNEDTLILSLLAVLPELLQGRPEWMVEQLQIRTPYGDLIGSLHLAAGGLQASDVNKANAVLRSVAMKGNLIIPKVVFRELLISYLNASLPSTPADLNQQIDNRINKWLSEGILLEKGQTYILDWSLLQGQWIVHNQPREFTLLKP